jgi:hypothetical protein
MSTEKDRSKFLLKLKRIWNKHPSFRFGQLIVNIHSFSQKEKMDLFDVEDYNMLYGIYNFGQDYTDLIKLNKKSPKRNKNGK